MASDTTLDNLKSWNVNYYTALVPFSILLYDYCLTFVAEVERCWGIRLNCALTLFYLNRYLVLFGHVPIMLRYFWPTSDPSNIEICHHLQLYHEYLAFVVQAVISCIVIMRMYALYEQSRKVLALYIIVAALISVVALWALLGGHTANPRDFQIQRGCGVVLSRERVVRVGAAWAAMLVFDSLVFSMTLYKSIVLPRPNRMNILDILLRDGTIYFGVMLAGHLTLILTNILGDPFINAAPVTFVNVISSVMISRLMLNLRDPSLVLNRRRASFITSSTETFPITTIVELEHATQFSVGTSYPGPTAPTPRSQPQVGPVPHDIQLISRGGD